MPLSGLRSYQRQLLGYLREVGSDTNVNFVAQYGYSASNTRRAYIQQNMDWQHHTEAVPNAENFRPDASNTVQQFINWVRRRWVGGVGGGYFKGPIPKA